MFNMLFRFEDDYETEILGQSEDDCFAAIDELMELHGGVEFYTGVTDGSHWIDGEYYDLFDGQEYITYSELEIREMHIRATEIEAILANADDCDVDNECEQELVSELEDLESRLASLHERIEMGVTADPDFDSEWLH